MYSTQHPTFDHVGCMLWEMDQYISRVSVRKSGINNFNMDSSEYTAEFA